MRALDLLVGDDPVAGGLLHVEDLALDGEDSLEAAVPAHLGGAAG